MRRTLDRRFPSIDIIDKVDDLLDNGRVIPEGRRERQQYPAVPDFLERYVADQAMTTNFKKSRSDSPGRVEQRLCLKCRSEFTSRWVGERLCKRCRETDAWRTGSSSYEGVMKSDFRATAAAIMNSRRPL